MKEIAFCVLVLLTLSLQVAAQEEEDFVVRDDLAAAVSGQLKATGLMTLTVVPGPFAQKAIRIYSEPSHTLLVLILDNEFAKSVAAEPWLADALAGQEPLARVTTDLPSGQPRLHMQTRPSADQRIAVWINGVWPDQQEEDLLVADNQVGTGDFAFSTYLRKVRPASGDQPAAIQWEHCCSGGGCEKEK
jgi:hypothetical protein